MIPAIWHEWALLELEPCPEGAVVQDWYGERKPPQLPNFYQRYSITPWYYERKFTKGHWKCQEHIYCAFEWPFRIQSITHSSNYRYDTAQSYILEHGISKDHESCFLLK